MYRACRSARVLIFFSWQIFVFFFGSSFSLVCVFSIYWIKVYFSNNNKKTKSDKYDHLPGLRRIAFHFLPYKLALRAATHDAESNHHLYHIRNVWRKIIIHCTYIRNEHLRTNIELQSAWDQHSILSSIAYRQYHTLWTEILSYLQVIGQQIDEWHRWIPAVISNQNCLCRRFETLDS